MPIAERSKYVGIEIIVVATTPSRKAPSLYKVVLSALPDEAQEEWQKLQGTYESPTSARFFSKDEMKKQAVIDLNNGLLDIDKHVAPSRYGTKRPDLYPPIEMFYPVARELQGTRSTLFYHPPSPSSLPSPSLSLTISVLLDIASQKARTILRSNSLLAHLLNPRTHLLNPRKTLARTRGQMLMM